MNIRHDKVFKQKVKGIFLLTVVAFALQFLIFEVLPRYKAALTHQTELLKQDLGSCSEFVPKNQQEEEKVSSYVNSLDFSGIKNYVMFFGDGRTGHSWIGTILDASPNALIANEFDAFRYFDSHRKLTRDVLLKKLATNSYICGLYGRIQVYNYTIPGLWQGSLQNNNFQIIGDKKGYGSTATLSKMGKYPWSNPSDALSQKSFFETFFSMVGLEPKLIIVLRNPFNVISTNSLRKGKVWWKRWLYLGMDVLWTKFAETNKPKVLDASVQNRLNAIRTAMWAKANLGKPHYWHVMTMEDFGSNTEVELRKLCNFTSIECPQKLIDKVVQQTHHDSHDTWHLVSWRQDQIEEVNKLIRDELQEFYSPLAI